MSGRGRLARGVSGKRKTSGIANVFRNLANPVGGGDEVDGGRKGYGRDVYIENNENHFADRNAWRADGGRQLGQRGTTCALRAERVREGGGELHECLGCRYADLDGWETEGMSTLKTKKTASRTGTRLECGWGATTWTTQDRLHKAHVGVQGCVCRLAFPDSFWQVSDHAARPSPRSNHGEPSID